MRWRIKGELRENGLRVEELLEADDASDALNKAIAKGIAVTEMAELAEEIPASRVLSYQGPSTPEPPQFSRSRRPIGPGTWSLIIIAVGFLLIILLAMLGLFHHMQ